MLLSVLSDNTPLKWLKGLLCCCFLYEQMLIIKHLTPRPTLLLTVLVLMGVLEKSMGCPGTVKGEDRPTFIQ